MLSTLALWATILLFPLPLVMMLNSELDDAASLRFTITLGLIAYSWWLLVILLSLRPRWLDRRVGLTSIYALHGFLGVVALVPAYLHRENTFAPTQLVRLVGDISFWIAVGVVAWSVLFMSGWITDGSSFIRRIRLGLERIFRRQFSLWVHRLNLVAVALIWSHVHLIDRVTQHFNFMVLFDFYTLVVLGLYVWKKWIAPDGYLQGTITQNAALNSTTRGVTVTLDEVSRTSRAGDFYFLRLETDESSSEWHPFSATNAHQDDLTFTIRQTGDFTKSLATTQVGTRVRLEGPYGRFDSILQQTPTGTPVVFIGMGAGVAPLLSLVDGHVGRFPIELLWSMKHQDDAYYDDYLRELHRRAGGQLKVTRQVGRFRPEQLSELLDNLRLQHGVFVLVGPNNAVLAQQRVLGRLGVERARIHHERLTM